MWYQSKEYTIKEIKNKIESCFYSIKNIDCKINKTLFTDKNQSNIDNNLLYRLLEYIELDYNNYKKKYNLTDEQLKNNYYFLVDIKADYYWHNVKTYLTLKF